MIDIVPTLLARRTELITDIQRMVEDVRSIDHVVEHFHRSAPNGRNGHAPDGDQADYDLTHTKLHHAWIDNSPIEHPDWNTVLALVANKLASRDDFKRFVTPVWIEGENTGIRNSHRYVPKFGISYHGMSANDAWKIIERIADHLGLTVDVKFRWPDTPKAQHPGVTATLSTRATEDRNRPVDKGVSQACGTIQASFGDTPIK